MIVGIFAEGRGDLAVITNILKGALGIDRADIRYELPEFEYDQTDLSTMTDEQFSSWTLVKKTCQEQTKIDAFFDNPIEQESFIVLHLDTAERHRDDYGVKEPVKAKDLDSKTYCREVRANVIEKINSWLGNSYPDKIAYAIAVEETDAWVLTIYDKANTDTSAHQNPKKRLNDELNRSLKKSEKNILTAKAYHKYDTLTNDFRKKKKLATCLPKNESLKLFCESLKAFTPTLL